MGQWRPAWKVFDDFPVRPRKSDATWRASWSPRIDCWLAAVRETATAEAQTVLPLLGQWDDALSSIGGDPARENWERFRPLRLSREEDWSDWLAFVLASPEAYEVAARLFAPAGPSTILEEVRREEPVLYGKRRADLVLLWDNNRASSIEVKIGDTNFRKTDETALECHGRFRDRCDWRDFILLPDEDEEAWSECCPKSSVACVTWTSVAIELRRQLLRTRGSHQWLAFARTFCGAVEQKLLGVPRLALHGPPPIHIATMFKFGRIIREASASGRPD